MQKQKGFSLIGILLIIGALVITASGVVGLPAVRQVWEKKVLPTSIIPSPIPTTSPATPVQDADFISWEEAKQLILAGKVEQTHEFRDFTVNLFLKDGTRRTAKEPKINAVFKFIDQCGKPCSDIIKAME